MLDATNVGARRNRMRGAHFVFCIAVLIRRTKDGRVCTATCTCSCVGRCAIFVQARATGTGISRFDARIANTHDMSGRSETTRGRAEAGGDAADFDTTARLADGGGDLRWLAGG